MPGVGDGDFNLKRILAEIPNGEHGAEKHDIYARAPLFGEMTSMPARLMLLLEAKRKALSQLENSAGCAIRRRSIFSEASQPGRVCSGN